ncbi:hypothetical protein EV702DRAFT_1200616 [Suillus placidus]|uniref:Uncharacterized protein n=1 Tax=Suillus placidus TaxID=48579 RepID=A0A9P7CZN7_9AGAM|nr:hypothetical protein EV702DRAFT_1200616 [Suillus placidus]
MSSSPAPSYGVGGSPHSNINDIPPATEICSNIEGAGRKREFQTYMMSLDAIDMEDDEQDTLFAKYSVDTVYISYQVLQH